jgi:CubicO group peptidase (beta-lactamase class C family)
MACSDPVSILCSYIQIFLNVSLRIDPVAPTSHTPIYSNAGYQLLGYALESMLNAKYGDILADRIIKPLNLTRSTLHAPDPSLAVIPFNETFSYFSYALGDEDPYVTI